MEILEHVAIIEDERKHYRLNYSAEGQVETIDRRVVQGQIRDIALQSLYLYTDEDSDDFMIYGEQVKVKVCLRHQGCTLTVEVDGVVGRMDEQGFVVRFDYPLKWWPVFVIFPEHLRQVYKN